MFSKKCIGKFSINLLLVIGMLSESKASFGQDLTFSSYSGQSEISTKGSITFITGFEVPEGSNLSSFIIADVIPGWSTPSINQNFILTHTPRIPGIKDQAEISNKSLKEVNQSIQYFDGLGRLIQTIQTKASPDFRDIVQPAAYDPFGREVIKYLPYVAKSAESNGAYKNNAIADVGSFYADPSNVNTWNAPGVTSTPAPYAQARFDNSPLNRILEQGAPGAEWQISQGHTVKTEFATNNSQGFNPAVTNYNPGSKRVALYTVAINGDGTRTLLRFGNNAIYNNDELWVTVIKGENWTAIDGCIGTTEEYKDKEGRVILKRTYNKNGTICEMLSTYHVYDDLGQLSFILPPKANPDADAPVLQATLDNLCYQYKYDEKQRMVEKKIPGKGWDYIVYNKLNLIVMTQDANQRSKTPQEWLITKYDGLGREVITGMYTHSGSASNTNNRMNMQNLVNTQTEQWEDRITTGNGYSVKTFPASWTTTLTINYYDDYAFAGGIPYPHAGGSMKTRGLLTGSKVKILNNATGSMDMLWSISYFDELGRPTKQFYQHYKGGIVALGNYDEISMSYDFIGQITNTHRKHFINGNATPALQIIGEYTYDHMGRKKKTYQKINNDPKVMLSQLNYNELGQLITKKLHSTNDGGNFIQSIDYRYNERGWLSKINDPANVTNDRVFAMQLFYADHSDVNKRSYNGNISGVKWQTKVPPGYSLFQQLQSFDFSYDKLSRLLTADYTTNADGRFNEALTYDIMGNIKTLERFSFISGAKVKIDQLIYNYENVDMSHRLQKVTDNSGRNEGQANGVTSFSYDVNGNLSTDNTKPVSIAYNHLNLPQTITKTSTNEQLNYIYDASGRKLRKVIANNSRDYINGIEYTNTGSIDFIVTEEGRALNSTTFIYHYMLKDNNGNTRAMVKEDGSILQVQDYYAFGMDMNPGNSFNSSPDNLYKYGNKELQKEFNLNQYDFEARIYDPALGRWQTVDPLAEVGAQFSPYLFAFNNPIRFSDPSGMWPQEEGEDKYKTWFDEYDQAKRKRREIGSQVIASDFINKTNGKTIHIEDGMDQVMFVNNDQFNRISAMSTASTWSRADSEFYTGVLGSAETLDWNSDLGKIIRTVYSEMYGIGSTSDVDRQIVAESIVNRCSSCLYGDTYSDVLRPSQYNAVSTQEYKLGPYAHINSLQQSSPSFYQARKAGIWHNFLNAVSVSYLAYSASGSTIGNGVVSYVSPPLKSTHFDNDRYLKNITNQINGLKGISGAWKRK